MGAMDVAGAQVAPFQIAELIEHEQRMIAGTPEVPIVSCAFLVAMGRADEAIHVEDDHLRRMAVINLIDPHPVHVSQGVNVLIGGQ